MSTLSVEFFSTASASRCAVLSLSPTLVKLSDSRCVFISNPSNNCMNFSSEIFCNKTPLPVQNKLYIVLFAKILRIAFSYFNIVPIQVSQTRVVISHLFNGGIDVRVVGRFHWIDFRLTSFRHAIPAETDWLSRIQ